MAEILNRHTRCPISFTVAISGSAVSILCKISAGWLVFRTDDSEMAVTIGADGFSYTRDKYGEEKGFKLGNTR